MSSIKLSAICSLNDLSIMLCHTKYKFKKNHIKIIQKVKMSNLKKIFKYRIVKWLSLLLLLSSLVYVFGLENSLILIIYIVGLIKKNKVYIFIMTFILCILGILYAIWNLYVLHKYYISHNKNEEIFIPKTLPKFVIVKLEDLKMFSETEVGLNVFKDMYYTQIIFCIIFAIIYLVLIFYYM